MDSDEQQQKGLFTFYRQQADLEDEIKSKKKILRASKLDKIEQSQKKSMIHAHKIKIGHKKNLQSFSAQNQPVQAIQKGEKDTNQKTGQTKDKLIAILRKYNTKQLRKRDCLKIIMDMQEEPALNQAGELKNRLENLLSEEPDQYFKIIQSQMLKQQAQKLLHFTKKRQDVQRVNPFQRLAIIPTNFTTQLQEQKDLKLPLKKIHSPPKSLIDSVQVKKNDQIQAKIKQKQRYQGKMSQILSNQPLKLLLPKIDPRSNSQMLNKTKIKPSKLREKYYAEPVRSQRFKDRSQLSLFLDSIQPNKEVKNSQYLQNKIHALFIQNKESKRKEEVKPMDEQIKLADVIKRMNFS